LRKAPAGGPELAFCGGFRNAVSKRLILSRETRFARAAEACETPFVAAGGNMF
jgi:hypothetical protein